MAPHLVVRMVVQSAAQWKNTLALMLVDYWVIGLVEWRGIYSVESLAVMLDYNLVVVLDDRWVA